MRQHLGPGAHTRAWTGHEACSSESQPTPRRWGTSCCPRGWGARSARQELPPSASAPEAPRAGGDGHSSPEGLHPEQGTAGLREGGPHTKWAWAPSPGEGLMPSGGATDCGSSSPEGSRCRGQGEPEPRRDLFRQHLQVGRAEPVRTHHLSWGRQQLRGGHVQRVGCSHPTMGRYSQELRALAAEAPCPHPAPRSPPSKWEPVPQICRKGLERGLEPES